MRVLHVTSTFPRVDGDPTGPFLADLVTGQAEAGIEVRVIAPDAPGASRVVGGVDVVRFPGAGLAYRGGLLAAARGVSGVARVPAYLGGMALAVRRVVKGWRPDVIHAHWWIPAGAVASGAPVVITLHGSDLTVAEKLPWLARAVTGRAASVVAVSEALSASAQPLLRRPVEVAVMPVVVTTHRRATSASGRIAAVGRLVEEKGFDVLIDALPDGIQLDVVGDGPMLDALVKRAGDKPVRFLGALPRPELHALIAEVDAVAVPSRREGLGLVAVEAVLIGTPVIASATGGLPIALGASNGHGPGPVPGGVLVAPGDVGAWRAAIEQAHWLTTPSPAAAAAADRHRIERVVTTHLALYQGAI